MQLVQAFPVLAFVDLSGASPQLAVSCEPRAVPPEQQNLVAHAFQSSLAALLLQPEQRLRDVDLFTTLDHQMIASWNQHLPDAVTSCIHWKVSEVARLAPDAPAICAWDGDLTYARLEELSSLLASWLQAQGAGRGFVVALRLFKSRWAVVAMLAVVKAGGAFVSIDPTHPQDRQKRIAEDAGSSIMLIAEELASDAHTWTAKSFVVSEESILGLLGQTLIYHCQDTVKEVVHPCDAAYIVYTSGSTGSPKGIVVEHAALCTSVVEQAKAMRICPGSRVLQFAAYTFDVSVGDIFTTLTHGACLCIPSESGRRDHLANVMAEMKVSHACLTSTVAGILDPAEVPTLRMLTIGGEPVSRHNLVKWADKVELNNIYGPAECTVWCFVQRSVKADDNESKIGFGIGARGWIAHPDDSERLMPVGAVGELLIEGPLLARCYLNSPEKTTASFIVDPSWLQRFGPAGGRRLYKTGDLVKLRGQRIELGEIEYHLLLSMKDPGEVAVDVVQPPTGNGPVLAAFISIDDGLHNEPDENTISTEVKTRLVDIARHARPKMAEFLPSYMIPVVFVPVRAIPLTVSGKTNRRRLRQICSELSWSELLSISSPDEPEQNGLREVSGGVVVKTPAQVQMAEAWATLLGVAADDIRPSDGFISLGGDSLKAIHLVAVYRSMGLTLTVADILQNPRLASMASCAVPTSSSAANEQDSGAVDAAVSLVEATPDEALRDKLLAEFSEQCGVRKDGIVAIYPCTPLQEEMMELSLRGETSQFAHELARLWQTLDLARYRNAWEEVFQLHPILRTRFVQSSHDGKLKQVVVDEELKWEAPSDFNGYMAHNFSRTLRLGERLARWGLYREKRASQSGLSEPGGSQMLIISLHHSLFDGITLHQVFEDLYKAYQGHELARNLPNFGAYLGHLQADIKQQKHRDFWRNYLAGWEEARPFPSLPEPDYRSRAEKGTIRFLPFEGGKAFNLGDLTLSTLLRGSWSLFLAQQTGSQTVVFSTFLAGRNANVAGIERLVAPTFAHVPIKATISPGQTVRSFLAELQADAISMIPFEGTGMQTICETRNTAQVIRNLLVIQPMPGGGGNPASMPGDEDRTFPGDILCGPRVDAAAMGAFNPFPLLMECVMLDAGIAFRVSFDEAVLSAKAVEHMLDGFIAIIRALPARLNGAVPGPG
ncbi:AMP-binding enzyme [Hirsutella rhossiliensis]|uniref:AMP-binding enzyme domain-containing protein n=1 Tax=Hirsutella rhossiliensis TaxID=111463 RepID=A0A9P8N287_9HYPO|nr:AMP-binding enzyme domain-containing protein [Hirsutella rhossiliensis]KAH0965545.1 AMP-binding enzyme domain-containing protein [Hirsutella rhossiliensis]